MRACVAAALGHIDCLSHAASLLAVDLLMCGGRTQRRVAYLDLVDSLCWIPRQEIAAFSRGVVPSREGDLGLTVVIC